MKIMKNALLLLAGGKGKRYGGGLPKQYRQINNQNFYSNHLAIDIQGDTFYAMGGGQNGTGMAFLWVKDLSINDNFKNNTNFQLATNTQLVVLVRIYILHQNLLPLLQLIAIMIIYTLQIAMIIKFGALKLQVDA